MEADDLAFDLAEDFQTPKVRPKSRPDESHKKLSNVKKRLRLEDDSEFQGQPVWLEKEKEWQKRTSMGDIFPANVTESFSSEQKLMAQQTWLAMTPDGMMCVDCPYRLSIDYP